MTFSSSKSTPGNGCGRAPVAMMTFLASSVASWPSLSLTLIVVGPVSVPVPS